MRMSMCMHVQRYLDISPLALPPPPPRVDDGLREAGQRARACQVLAQRPAVIRDRELLWVAVAVGVGVAVEEGVEVGVGVATNILYPYPYSYPYLLDAP